MINWDRGRCGCDMSGMVTVAPSISILIVTPAFIARTWVYQVLLYLLHISKHSVRHSWIYVNSIQFYRFAISGSCHYHVRSPINLGARIDQIDVDESWSVHVKCEIIFHVFGHFAFPTNIHCIYFYRLGEPEYRRWRRRTCVFYSSLPPIHSNGSRIGAYLCHPVIVDIVTACDESIHCHEEGIKQVS